MADLRALLLAAAHGSFPPVDGVVEVVGPLEGGLEAVVSFTGHAVVATALEPAAVLARGPDAYGAALDPTFVSWLAGPDGWVGCLDATLVGFGSGRGAGSLARRDDLEDHPRVRHGRFLRSDLDVFADERGLVTLGRGMAGRAGLSVELAPADQGRGWGRSLVADALGLLAVGEPVFAAVSPGNARSLRAFLAIGFVPIGSELPYRPARP